MTDAAAPKLGQVCKHGHLERQCEICDLERETIALRAELAARDEAVLPAEALFAFMGWLTCRDETVRFGATENAAIAAELIDQFCKSQEWKEPRQEWMDRIKPYPRAALTKERG